MFRPTLPCKIQLASGKNDVRGQPIPGPLVGEKCAVVKLVISNEKSSVRADSSASRGTAQEMEAQSVILLGASTRAQIDDIIIVAGYKLRITGRQPRFDVDMRLDHYEINATMWGKE
jgi:hypothetical protein